MLGVPIKALGWDRQSKCGLARRYWVVSVSGSGEARTDQLFELGAATN